MPSMQGAESRCFDVELHLNAKVAFFWEGNVSIGGAWRGLIGPLWCSQEKPSQRHRYSALGSAYGTCF